MLALGAPLYRHPLAGRTELAFRRPPCIVHPLHPGTRGTFMAPSSRMVPGTQYRCLGLVLVWCPLRVWHQYYDFSTDATMVALRIHPLREWWTVHFMDGNHHVIATWV